jgi:hypothetical protein
MHMVYFFLTFLNIMVVESSDTASRCCLSFNNVIVIIMNTYFQEHFSDLASMFFQFKFDNDFTIRCIVLPRQIRN